MSLSAWEQQALNSIKDGLAGADPELAALLSAFDRLASDDEMPAREKIPAGSRRTPRWLRRPRRRSSLRKAFQRLSFQRAALLLWLLITTALVAVALALSASDHGTCTETAAMACTGPPPGHSPSSSSHNTTAVPASQQQVARIPQAGP